MTVTLGVERKGVAVNWDPSDYEGDVKLVGTGAKGDVHNTASMKNDGQGGLWYPADFAGDSTIQVIGVDDDQVVDEGTITVGS